MTTPNNNTTNTNGTLAVSKIDTLKNIISADSVQAQFKNALQDNTGPFVASLIDLYSGDQYLQNCEPKLVVMQALKAAVLKLPIIKSLGQAYVIPYKKDGVLIPQFQIGYKGYIQLAIRTGAYRILNADVVFDGEYKTVNKLTGEFDLTGTAKSETVIGYFAHFELKTGFSKTLFMTKEKVLKHAEKYSKSFGQQYGPWKTETDKMGIKTVLSLLLTHWGFMSTEMQQAFSADDDLAEQVREEIKEKANQKPMNVNNVQEAEEVKTEQPQAGIPF